MENQFRNSVIKAGIWYVELFEKDNASFIEAMVTLHTVRKLMVWVYCTLLADKKMSPIENLSIEEKKSLWHDAIQFSNGRLNKEQNLELSKVLYVLKVF